MSPHPRDKALPETEPTAAHANDLSKQLPHMFSHSSDKALPETKDTAILTNAQPRLPNNTHHEIEARES